METSNIYTIGATGEKFALKRAYWLHVSPMQVVVFSLLHLARRLDELQVHSP